ncbi:WD40-repeat-containing domain protein [Phakopsora pachyrhizi]|uniref:WD40-repeat-containing domain protein n=1 Tax=Phakopsora pachyrhizi TaxID=170000 RepID=A0AAV0BNL6_PHAPC|nr:WD40-repeat-containing domain protein [Phakopsora pachyrhizi]KAI8461679.1 WD40-repeat-containing domain protein [Phakopsora pachyrhizi]CAH7673173.1 WD40-repeat-containing domain protein [Phakopsora pachyrhizi]CAH7687800.1 WD40-repeat-containing domain protein [Phakopsora pachyrhizi]
MNLELQDPFAQDFPDTVETSLDSLAIITKFNPSGLFSGQYLAIGRLDGCVAIIDFETKRTLKFLMGHVKPITSLDWSRNSRFLLSAARDWNVIVWDLKSGERRYTIRFDAPVTSAQFHPLTSKAMVVTLQSQQEAIFVDLSSQGGRWELDPRPVDNVKTSLVENQLAEEGSTTQTKENHSKNNPRRKRLVATVARFNPTGDLVYVGTSQGSINIFETRTKSLVGAEQVSNNNSIKAMEFDSRGTSLVLNSNDRVIRVYTLEFLSNQLLPKMKLDHKFQDTIVRTPWQGCKFSSEYVVAGAGHKDSHQIFIWDRTSGILTKILEGPKDPLEAFDWHPTRPILASVSNVGLIHIWVTGVTENWSAYAPGFEELDENVEYREREDEFDYEDESDLERRRKDEQEANIEIFKIEPKSSAKLELMKERRAVLFGQTNKNLGDENFAEFEADEDDCEDFFIPIDYQLELKPEET